MLTLEAAITWCADEALLRAHSSGDSDYYHCDGERKLWHSTAADHGCRRSVGCGGNV
jgi:hypothetical protein